MHYLARVQTCRFQLAAHSILTRWPAAIGVAADSRGVEGRPQGKATAQVMAVQTSSALLSGLTTATLTNPLDVVKTRLQVWI